MGYRAAAVLVMTVLAASGAAVCSSGGAAITFTTTYSARGTPSTSCTSVTLADDRSPGGDEPAVGASERRLATSVFTCGLQAAFSGLTAGPPVSLHPGTMPIPAE